jgi:gamma-glutamylcyclotransferase (GGCT)/AIG2-like uncharacterized protein YtfP
MLYFAYGANLNKRAMKMRCAGAQAVGLAVLQGYKLCFRRWADIAVAKSGQVHGALWDVTEAGLRALDRYEGDDYRQIKVQVEHNGETVDAVAYAMHANVPLAPPDMEYYREVVVGYRDWGLDEQLLRRARYDVLGVGPGAPPTPAPAASAEPKAEVLPPRRRALWDPATQSSGAIDNLFGPNFPRKPR